ncbi:MAG: hypothetical protein D6806_17380, partial [Deltaproteobacteria bacterium]
MRKMVSCLLPLLLLAGCKGKVGGEWSDGGETPGEETTLDGDRQENDESYGSDDGGQVAEAPDETQDGGNGDDVQVSDEHEPLADGSCTDPSPPHTAFELVLRDLPPDSWYEAPGSHMRAVCPDIPGHDCRYVIDAWSGGACDPLHNRMLVFGGGHGDYPGNELYGFNLYTGEWERLTDPSPVEYKNQDPLPDGRPVSRHTYDGLQYIVHANRFFAVGGSRWQDGSGTHVTWTFDSDTRQWENRQPEDVPSFANCCSDASAYDPATGRVFIHATKFLAAYDYDSNRYVMLHDFGYPPLWPRYEVWGDKRCTVDTRRGLLWCLGSGLVMVYDIAGDSFVTDDWATTGGAPFDNSEQVGGHTEQLFHTTGGEVITAQGPGVDYDPVSDDLVAWVGGGPWILDLDSKHWMQGSAEGAPPEPARDGTYGRWRYVARTNV